MGCDMLKKSPNFEWFIAFYLIQLLILLKIMCSWRGEAMPNFLKNAAEFVDLLYFAVNNGFSILEPKNFNIKA